MDTQFTSTEPQHCYNPIFYPSVSVQALTTTSNTNPTIKTSLDKSSVTVAARPTPKAKAHSFNLDGSLDAAIHSSLPTNTISPSPSIASVSTSTPSNTALLYPTHVDLVPIWWPHQPNVYYAQLLHYNRLISPARGGGLQAPPLPPVVSASNAQAVSRPRSPNKVSPKNNSTGKGNPAAGGHGSRLPNNHVKTRPVITSPESKPTSKMPPKGAQAQASDAPKKQAPRSVPSTSAAKGVAHSSSVPSTPHQYPRQFSSKSRDPSPNEAVHNHSPRSVYSETSGNLPSLKPLPPPRIGGGCRYETAQANSRRRMPYSGGSERLESKDLSKLKGKLTEEEEIQVATDMREVYDRLLPTEAVEEKRKLLLKKLEDIFNKEWPGHDIRAHLFGSSGNLLCSDASDVDVCIVTKWRDMENVCIIADLLARRGMEKVVCISAAKVPIVKIWDPELSLACDINVNNTNALENTRLIRTYVEIDPRVRQLAMIIKYWTRRRIINDAALGGTLSSYTWICLIIAFLQLRTPPVLPALHQMPYKLMRPDNSHSAFADNLRKLRGYGSKNKSSEADLLFQFFRFYAHEFDYDKYILSIRLGRLIPRADKGWVQGIAGVYVEEPFNTARNLGNTADEYSFRGLHLELRRAFDLLSEAKFKEACEEYMFPKEEERVWSRPAPRRPVLLRSASQSNSTRGGRGGNRGGRHHNYRGGGNGSNRRPSSSVPAYDTSSAFASPIAIQQQDSWPVNSGPPYHMAYTNEMMAMAYQENMRQMQYYAQSAAYNPSLTQPIISSTSSSGQATTSDRSRTNSFDNAPPVTAPMRQDLWQAYNMGLTQPFFVQHLPHGTNYGQYLSSPTTPNGATSGQDIWRPLQRSSGMAERGAQTPSSSLRSQSQPAARSQPSVQMNYIAQPAFPMVGLGPPSINGAQVATFGSTDAEVDSDETPRGKETPRAADNREGYFVARLPSPDNGMQHAIGGPNGTAHGDVVTESASSTRRRRLSTEQTPQTILDRRMRRASRSPSPMRQNGSLPVGTNPSTSQGAKTQARTSSTRPLVVNGSGMRGNANMGSREPAASSFRLESATSNQRSPMTFAHSSHNGQSHTVNKPTGQSSVAAEPGAEDHAHTFRAIHPPVVVNGSNTAPTLPINEDASFRDRIAAMRTMYMSPVGYAPQQDMPWMGNRYAPAMPQQMPPHPQSAVIAPLDLATDNRMGRVIGNEGSLLSPVYEIRTPSPSTMRKPNMSTKSTKGFNTNSEPKTQTADENVREPHGNQRHFKAHKSGTGPPKSNSSRDHGHVRGAKSEGDGGWQKAGKNKRKGPGIHQSGHAETPPKSISERKGG